MKPSEFIRCSFTLVDYLEPGGLQNSSNWISSQHLQHYATDLHLVIYLALILTAQDSGTLREACNLR